MRLCRHARKYFAMSFCVAHHNGPRADNGLFRNINSRPDNCPRAYETAGPYIDISSNRDVVCKMALITNCCAMPYLGAMSHYHVASNKSGFADRSADNGHVAAKKCSVEDLREPELRLHDPTFVCGIPRPCGTRCSNNAGAFYRYIPPDARSVHDRDRRMYQTPGSDLGGLDRAMRSDIRSLVNLSFRRNYSCRMYTRSDLRRKEIGKDAIVSNLWIRNPNQEIERIPRIVFIHNKSSVSQTIRSTALTGNKI